ncbi:hypothetical protein GT755_10790 [Herbidospora sp. NEAU-GS84]|uniref:Uncharacterized protein n=1 Tax=Herbidospora solisilvae TaxID=2696284 RepID=A0A7C9N0F8_9ACTN|nr:hypothetical protein [Herbidospora solisilvae]NAS22169.1 hypothetical protein [Herbidospora solisilvae]
MKITKYGHAWPAPSMPEPFSVAGFDISVAGEKHHFSHPGDALTVVDAPGDHADDGLVSEWGLKVLGGVLEMKAERAVSDYRRLEIVEI